MSRDRLERALLDELEAATRSERGGTQTRRLDSQPLAERMTTKRLEATYPDHDTSQAAAALYRRIVRDAIRAAVDVRYEQRDLPEGTREFIDAVLEHDKDSTRYHVGLLAGMMQRDKNAWNANHGNNE